MEKRKSQNLSTVQKIFAVICGALLSGFMWRVRGNHGFGAMWGMLCFAAALTLFIFALFGKRQKMNFEMIAVTASAAAITVGGWGTLNSQMSGYLLSSANFTGEEAYRLVEISPYSGLAIMLMLGFGWMPLFSVVLGSLFSKRKYEFKDYVVFVGVYYAAMLLSCLTVSHYILSVINPQAVEGAVAGLADRGYEFSPYVAYIKNFASAAWAKKIPFCRNYFTSIKVIASAIGALACSASVRFVLKDKFTARFSVVINLICAVAITAADIPLILGYDRGFFAGVGMPSFLQGCAWSIWEFFTGFFIGLGVMLTLVLLPKKYTDREENYQYSPLFKNKKISLAFNSVFTLFITLFIVPVRAFSMRLLEVFGADEEIFEIILTVVLGIIVFIPCLKIAKKNIIANGLDTPVNMSATRFAATVLPPLVIFCAVAIFFIGNPEELFWYFNSKLFTVEGFLEYWHGGALFERLTNAVAVILFFVTYKLCIKKEKAA